MGTYPELDNASLPDLIRRFNESCPEGEKFSAGYFMEVALNIRRQGTRGIRFLREQLEASDPQRVRAALFGLTGTGRALMTPIALLHFLRDKREEVVAEAIDALGRLRVGKALPEVQVRSRNRGPFVIGAFLRFVSRTSPHAAPALLLKALSHPEYIVRENAIDELDSLGCVQALPALKPLLRDPHKHVRQAAKSAIKNLKAKA